MTEELNNILEETGKCLYCGFCEAVCPTLPFGPHRGYGPRGRVYLAREIASTGKASGEALSSIFSCLTCGACTIKCPTRISVAGLVKKMRSLVLSGRIESDLGMIVIKSR
ncbi:MAG: (Fe-S)-binding protein [Desulfurococcales archaeon]|nr:(Fe-S)-binding protein [Desulfurococcales archaeon]